MAGHITRVVLGIAVGLLVAACSGDDGEPEADQVSECADPAGDGTRGDLLGTELAMTDDTLTVTWETAEPLEGASFAYYLYLSGARVGLTVEGQEDPVAVVLDTTGGESLSLDSDDFTLDGTRASVTAPLSALEAAVPPFQYSSVLSIEGVDVDVCDGSVEE